MRIISQNGMNDYPYEHCFVFVNRKERTQLCIGMCGDSDDNNYFEIANYASEEDAKFVIEMIGASYMIGSHWMHMPDWEQAITLRESYLTNRKDEECYYRYLKRIGAHIV